MEEAVRKDIRITDSPLVIWDYCIECQMYIYNMMAWDDFKVCRSNPHTLMTGEEGNISNLCQYGWYDWCYYCVHTARFPYNQEVLGRVLGSAHYKGNELAQWVLKVNGNIMPR